MTAKPADDKLPTGIEVTYTVYITSESEGLNVAFNITLKRNLTFTEPPNPVELLASFGQNLAEAAPDWRLMTAEEITAYKEDNQS